MHFELYVVDLYSMQCRVCIRTYGGGYFCLFTRKFLNVCDKPKKCPVRSATESGAKSRCGSELA